MESLLCASSYSVKLFQAVEDRKNITTRVSIQLAVPKKTEQKLMCLELLRICTHTKTHHYYYLFKAENIVAPAKGCPFAVWKNQYDNALTLKEVFYVNICQREILKNVPQS